MSVVLQTGVMHYRENEQDQWRPLIIKAQSIDFEALVDPYEPTVPKSWLKGEYCLQDDKIWRCVNPVTTPADFDEDDWVQTTFGYEIEQLGIAVQDSEPNYSKVWIDTDETTSVTVPTTTEFNAFKDTVADELGIVVNGNKTTHTGGASIGQYVIVKNSSITDITDGLYTAAKAIPANTVIDNTYLTAVDNGGLNDLKNLSKLRTYTLLFKTNVTDGATISTFGGREFNDYPIITFYLFASSSDSFVRAAVTMSSGQFGGEGVDIMAHHGTNLENYSGMRIQKTSASSITVYLKGNKALVGLGIEGFKTV